MKRSILEIYAMLACLLLGLYGLFIVTVTISDALYLAKPEWLMTSDKDQQYATNEAFCAANFNSCQDVSASNMRAMTMSQNGNPDYKTFLQEQQERWAKEDQERQEKYSPEAITKKRLEALDFQKSLRLQRITMGLVDNIIRLLIIFGLFCVHWKIGLKARSQPEAQV